MFRPHVSTQRFSLFLVYLLLASGVFVVFPPSGSAAEGDDSAPVLLILDASGSMKEDDGTGATKIDAARVAVRDVVDAAPADQELGLRVFGHRVSSSDKAAACRDTELVVPVGTGNRGDLLSVVNGVEALGETPIGLSLQQAQSDLGESGGSVVLVSDGADECYPDLGPAPCDVAKEIAAGGIDLQVHTIGFQTDAAANDQLKCIADATGGSFVTVESGDELATQLTAKAVRDARRIQVEADQVVEGSPDPDRPAVLPGAGTYLDSFVADEVLWWRIDVPAEKRLKVTVTAVPGAVEELPMYSDLLLTVGPAGLASDDYRRESLDLDRSSPSSFVWSWLPQLPDQQAVIRLEAPDGVFQFDVRLVVELEDVDYGLQPFSGEAIAGGASESTPLRLGNGTYSMAMNFPGKTYLEIVSASEDSPRVSLRVPIEGEELYFSSFGEYYAELMNIRIGPAGNPTQFSGTTMRMGLNADDVTGVAAYNGRSVENGTFAVEIDAVAPSRTAQPIPVQIVIEGADSDGPSDEAVESAERAAEEASSGEEADISSDSSDDSDDEAASSDTSEGGGNSPVLIAIIGVLGVAVIFLLGLLLGRRQSGGTPT
ncbi:MAG: VWA domain-containing protein [Actinobacteria bacterium]|nr:VWA domain-containing protein [Actinomycetota bacterium]MCB9388136.1 VWA domain-containing protein [Acidimicrobiia bacterium]